MTLEGDGLSVRWYLRPRPVGKVRRRVQELRYRSSFPAAPASAIDLSHSESARIATDALLDRGLEAYQEALARDGEVDFLSQAEKDYILGNVREAFHCDGTAEEEGEEQAQETSASLSELSQTYFPMITDSEPPGLDYGWPAADWSDHLQGIPSVEVFFQSDKSARMKDQLRGFISKATTVIETSTGSMEDTVECGHILELVVAIVMDTFSDVEIFCDILEATRKRNVSVYLLLDHIHLQVFVDMCESLQINSSHLTKMSVRSVHGETYCAKSGRKFAGQIKEKFIIIDCTQVLIGSFSFTWLSGQVHRSLAMLCKGGGVKPFDLEFRRLYATSKPVPGFLAATASLDLPLLSIPEQVLPRPALAARTGTAQRAAPLILQHSTQARNVSDGATGQPGLANQPSPAPTQTRFHWLPLRQTVYRPVVSQRSFSTDRLAWRHLTNSSNHHVFGRVPPAAPWLSGPQ